MKFHPFALLRIFCLLVLVAGMGSVAWGQLEFDREPILYSKTEANDPIAKLQRRIDAGETKLQYDEKLGYLEAVLKELKVPATSDVGFLEDQLSAPADYSARTPGSLLRRRCLRGLRAAG